MRERFDDGRPHRDGAIGWARRIVAGVALVLVSSTASAEGGAAEPAGAPHAHGGSEHFQAPKDRVVEEPSLPAGTLEIHVADEGGKPLSHAPVTVGVLSSSVAKGERRTRISVTTDASGVARLDALESGSTVAYRPMVLMGSATFSSTPFRLPERGGMRVLLHVYPVVEEIEQALVATQSFLYVEVKDDRIQVQQLFKVFNLGKSAWVPKDLVLPLPERFTAFTSQQGMTDVGAEAVPKKGVRVHGTFGPGPHEVAFRWQHPYSGEGEVRFDVGVLPRMATSRVLAPASKDMILEVPGYPPPQSTSDGAGQRVLVTERQVRRDDPPQRTVSVILRGLPTEGPGKLIATVLAAGGLLFGLVLGAKRPPDRDRRRQRDRLLGELDELERGRRTGDIGPKTYERARKELIDALAQTFAEEAASAPLARKNRKRRTA